jgi:hypothetical protein
MPAFNCVRCGHENSLNTYGYGGKFKGKLTCPICRAVHEAQMESMNILSLELAGFDPLALSSTTPEDVLADYYEAQRCSQVNAFKAVVTLCRRALQSAVDMKGADKKGDLKNKIDELTQKKLISPDIASLAHGIRFFGNYGAHPQDDELKQITELEAQTIFSLTGQILLRLFEPISNPTITWQKQG